MKDLALYDVGVSWFSLDHHLGTRHSQLNASSFYGDFYVDTTLLLCQAEEVLSGAQMNALRDWVEQGGTLIAHNSSTSSLNL